MSRNMNDFGSFKPCNGSYLLKTPTEQGQNTVGKVCTPNRPRLISAGEPNSTPISIARKNTNQRIASPLLARINKQNQQLNFAQPSPGKLAIKIKPTGLELHESRAKSPFIREKTSLGTAATLSPFNKMSEGLKSYMQYGTIPDPTNVERYSTVGAARIDLSDEDALKSSNSFKMMGSRKGSLVSLSPVGLQKDRSPNSHLNEQKRLKHEVIDDIIKNCGKKQQQLRTSNSNQNFMGFGRPLAESKSFNRLDSNKFGNAVRESTTHEAFLSGKEEDDGATMCLNRDGKRAKYRVVNNNPDEDEEPMYYCSKCAIQLIQQGFKVEQIEEEPQRQNDGGNMVNKINDLQAKLNSKRDRVKKMKDQYTQQFQADLEQVNTYYDSLISTIEELRVRDRETILNHRDSGFQANDDLLNRLQSGITRLPNLQNDAKRRLDHDSAYRLQEELRQLSNLCDAPERMARKEVCVEENVQDKFDHFVNVLYETFTLKIEGASNQGPSNYGNMPQQQQMTKAAVNFSFEKNKMMGQAKKLDALQSYIKEESEAEEKNNSEEESVERKPFRNLFPDDSEPEHSEHCQQQLERGDAQGEMEQEEEEEDGNYQCHSPSFKNL